MSLVNGLVKKITKIPNTNDLVIGGDLNFEYNGDQYVGMFRLNSSFNITPIEGITNLPSNTVINDILFVNDSECDGTLIGTTTAYIAGSITQMSGVSSFRGIVKYTVSNGTWIISHSRGEEAGAATATHGNATLVRRLAAPPAATGCISRFPRLTRITPNWFARRLPNFGKTPARKRWHI